MSTVIRPAGTKDIDAVCALLHEKMNAKIAVDGHIVDRPANESRRRASLEPQLIGPPRGNTARPTRSVQGGRRLV